MKTTDRDISRLSPALGLCAVLVLSACAQKADLGRDTQNRWSDLVTRVTTGGASTSALAETSAEQYLRAQAATIGTEPSASKPDLLARVSATFGKEETVAPSLVYYTKLRAAHPTSLVSLVNTIGDDVQIDTVRLVQFTNICDDVNNADATRAEGLIGAPTAKTSIASEDPLAFRGARARLSENGQVIDTTFRTMEARLVSYRTALAHARLDSDETVDMDGVEAAIRRLDDELTRLDGAAQRHQAIRLSLMSGAKA